MMKSIAYADQVCPRCGSKQRISKTWKESIQTFSGTIEVDCSQIICTNEACQGDFDENLKNEMKKKEDLRQQKAAKDIARKQNSLLHAQATRAAKKV